MFATSSLRIIRSDAGSQMRAAHAAASAADPVDHDGRQLSGRIEHNLMRASADDADVTRRLQLLLQQLFAAQASLQECQCALRRATQRVHLKSHPVSVT